MASPPLAAGDGDVARALAADDSADPTDFAVDDGMETGRKLGSVADDHFLPPPFEFSEFPSFDLIIRLEEVNNSSS